MTFPTYQVVFYIFSVLLVIASLAVITVRNPVRAALFLIMAFVCCAVIWMLLQAEFLSLALIFCVCRRGDDVIFICGDDA